MTRILLVIDRPGSLGTSQFFATRGDGRPLGRVRQENVWLAPRFEFALAAVRDARKKSGD